MICMPYYVYVLLCEDGSYYTGYARDIDLANIAITSTILNSINFCPFIYIQRFHVLRFPCLFAK